MLRKIVILGSLLSVRARYDDLEFTVVPLFRDGFETGDLTAWSASVP